MYVFGGREAPLVGQGSMAYIAVVSLPNRTKKGGKSWDIGFHGMGWDGI